jgi:phage shock protein A
MKLISKSYWFTLLLLMMSAVPAFAQFEISPDHFDDNPSSSQQADHSNSVAALILQIAEQKKLLASYQDQLLQKTALMEKARQALRNSGNAAARNDVLRQQRELRELRQSLTGPVHEAKLALARLERQQQTLHPVAERRRKRSTTAILSASK